MSLALLSVSTTKEVKDYTKKLIQTCGKGGGYIMMSLAAIDEAKPENIRAWIDTTKEYSIYK
jgi:uroporphyrinogen-III decarboxylase